MHESVASGLGLSPTTRGWLIRVFHRGIQLTDSWEEDLVQEGALVTVEVGDRLRGGDGFLEIGAWRLGVCKSNFVIQHQRCTPAHQTSAINCLPR